MKIKVTIERECCEPQDMLPYSGIVQFESGSKPKFCKHCGQLWIAEKYTDAAGDRDVMYVRFVPEMRSK